MHAGLHPLFRVLFPNQVIRADDLAWAMVDVVTTERKGLVVAGSSVLENRAIRRHDQVAHAAIESCCAMTRVYIRVAARRTAKWGDE